MYAKQASVIGLFLNLASFTLSLITPKAPTAQASNLLQTRDLRLLPKFAGTRGCWFQQSIEPPLCLQCCSAMSHTSNHCNKQCSSRLRIGKPTLRPQIQGTSQWPLWWHSSAESRSKNPCSCLMQTKHLERNRFHKWKGQKNHSTMSTSTKNEIHSEGFELQAQRGLAPPYEYCQSAFAPIQGYRIGVPLGRSMGFNPKNWFFVCTGDLWKAHRVDRWNLGVCAIRCGGSIFSCPRILTITARKPYASTWQQHQRNLSVHIRSKHFSLHSWLGGLHTKLTRLVLSCHVHGVFQEIV